MANTLNLIEKTIEKSKKNEEQQRIELSQAIKQRELQSAAEANIADLKASLRSARLEVQKAQYEVYQLQTLPPIPEPTFWEERREARASIPTTTPHQQGEMNT